jgi:hypothetical protein
MMEAMITRPKITAFNVSRVNHQPLGQELKDFVRI